MATDITEQVNRARIENLQKQIKKLKKRVKALEEQNRVYIPTYPCLPSFPYSPIVIFSDGTVGITFTTTTS